MHAANSLAERLLLFYFRNSFKILETGSVGLIQAGKWNLGRSQKPEAGLQ